MSRTTTDLDDKALEATKLGTAKKQDTELRNHRLRPLYELQDLADEGAFDAALLLEKRNYRG
ncbi:type II toxin-antitoxin system VapB family antitoxin [Streptomyces pseudogriseolus]|uniref:type II toxin-antitoxin system VapB family antitoxin n=1 Tax=Streptomyces pseudogriseolus TaxID=36817 RepID=UPI003FA2C339